VDCEWVLSYVIVVYMSVFANRRMLIRIFVSFALVVVAMGSVYYFLGPRQRGLANQRLAQELSDKNAAAGIAPNLTLAGAYNEVISSKKDSESFTRM
jgi:hypothetical protein